MAIFRDVGDRSIGPPNCAAARLDQSRQGFGEHCLSASNHAGDADDLAGANLQVDIRQVGLRFVVGRHRNAPQRADVFGASRKVNFLARAESYRDEIAGSLFMLGSRWGGRHGLGQLANHLGGKLLDRDRPRSVTSDDLAAPQHRDPVGNLFHLVELVADVENRTAASGKAAHDPAQRLRILGRQ
jgi:hypothetical protein